MQKMKYSGNSKNYTLDCEDTEEIKNLLLYRKIEKVEGNTFFLDNGTTLEVVPNEGCGGCGNGWYDIDEINGCDNAITDVCVVSNDDETCFNIFVYAEHKALKILEVTGNDNGYYGTGYKLKIRIPRELDEKDDYEL